MSSWIFWFSIKSKSNQGFLLILVSCTFIKAWSLVHADHVDYLNMYIVYESIIHSLVIKIMSIFYNTIIHHFFLKENVIQNYIYQETEYMKVVKYVHVPVILSLIYTDKILQLINRGKTDWKKLHIPKFVKTPAKCLHAIFQYIYCLIT